MGIHIFPYQQEREALKRWKHWTITPRGREKLEGGKVPDKINKILMCLSTEGSGDMDDISQSTKISKKNVEKLLPQLAHAGVIQAVGTGGDN